jgi:hypothetical protein
MMKFIVMATLMGVALLCTPQWADAQNHFNPQVSPTARFVVPDDYDYCISPRRVIDNRFMVVYEPLRKTKQNGRYETTQAINEEFITLKRRIVKSPSQGLWIDPPANDQPWINPRAYNLPLYLNH